MANAGRVSVVPKGNWQADIKYSRLDFIKYSSALYLAKKDVPIGTLPTDQTYWMFCGETDITSVQDAINKIIDGDTIVGKAWKDSDGNFINTTYAKVADSELSTESENPVQNKVITKEFNKKVNTTDLMTAEKNGIGKPDGKTITADANGTLSVKTQFSHNIPRIVPKDITSYYSDGSLWYRLNGTNGYTLFEDIFIGDYIKMSRPISAYNQDQNYQLEGSQYVTIAGIDTLQGNGDTVDMMYHHLVMIPGQGFGGIQHFGRSRMNATHTTDGGYVGSEMYTTTLGVVTNSGSTATTATVNQQLYAEFGSHLKTTRELLSNNLNATGTNRFGNDGGCSNNWNWYDCQAVLMSEVECYGSIVWSSSGFDVGSANTRLPLFTYSTSAMNNRSAWYWLKGVTSASNFCICGSIGIASYDGASLANGFVRPRFVIAA